MELGRRLWKLSRAKWWVAAAAAVALVVALFSVFSVSLSPLAVTPRALQMASAETSVIVDTPRSAVLDLRQNTYGIQALTQRAVLIGNVIANGAVRDAIASQAHVPLDLLEIEAPVTPQQPTPAVGSPSNSVKAITKSNDQYRISVSADATVPMLTIYAQAPSAATAAALANSSVTQLRTYLGHLSATQQIPSKDQIRLLQLGQAHGTVINKGIYWQIGVLVFLVVFALACAGVIFARRVREGWKLAALAEQLPSVASSATDLEIGH